MKILHVVHQFPDPATGGTERSVAALAREQKASGHDVSVVTGTLESGRPDQPVATQRHGVDVYEIRRDDLYFEEWWKAWHPGVTDSFARLVEKLSPDLVHVHHWLRLTSDLVRTARRLGATTVVSAHDHFTVLGRPARVAGESSARRGDPRFGFLGARELDEAFEFLRRDLCDELRAADLRIAPSAAHAASLAELAPRAAGGLGDFEVVPPPLWQCPGRVDGPFEPRARLLAWGTWYAEKGLETVFDAMRLAKSHGANWQLDVLGEAAAPGYGKRLQRAAEGLAVTLHPGAFDTDRLEQVAGGGAFAVLPTLAHESYGMTLDEARWLGLPGFVSDVPSLRERAGEHQACFEWFRAGDAEDLARKLIAVHGALAARVELRPPAPDDLLDAAAIAARIEQLYERARRRPAAVAGPPLVGAGERSVHLWRFGERRFWSSLQADDGLPSPPDSLLGEA